MRDLNLSSLQERMQVLDIHKNGVSSLIGETISKILKLMPSTDIGKRLLPFIGDNLLLISEHASKKGSLVQYLKMISNDIVDALAEREIVIDENSEKWLNIQMQIKDIAFLYLSEYCKLANVSNENDNSEIPNVGKKNKKGVMNITIANNIRDGNDGIERVEIAGTKSLVVPGKCIQMKTRGGYIETHPWVPEIVKYYSIPDAPLTMRKLYLIKVNGDKEQLCTLEEIEKGTAWSKFPHATGTNGAQNRSLLANIVETLATKTEIMQGYVTDGWNIRIDKDNNGNETLKKIYVLEDGRGLDGKEYCVPTILNDVIQRGKERLTLPVEPVSIEQVQELMQWLYMANSQAHGIIAIALQFRNYLTNIQQAYTSFFLYSQPCDNTRDTSRLGKTMLQQASCNLSFPTYHNDSTHGSFSGTPGGIEKLIAQKQSSNCIIDDLQISPVAGIKDVKEVSQQINMVVKTTADNKAARVRLQRNRELAESNYFQVLAFINGEIMPPVLSSLERRMISITIKPGDVNIDMYKDKWDEYAKILLSIGHMALRAIEIQRNSNDNELKKQIKDYEKRIERQLRIDVKTELNESLSQLCDDMPKVYSCILSGIFMLGTYAFNEHVGNEWSMKLYPFVLQALIKQICKMDGIKTAEDKGSLVSLLHIIRDTIASNGKINGNNYRIVARPNASIIKDTAKNKEVGNPDVHREDGTSVNSFYFCGLANYRTTQIFAYIDVNSENEYVMYLTELGYEAIISKAKTLEEYQHLKSKREVQYALKAENLLARTSKDKNYVHVRIPGVSNKSHYEILLSAYLDEPLKVPEKETKSLIDLEQKRQEKQTGDTSEDSGILDIANSED